MLTTRLGIWGKVDKFMNACVYALIIFLYQNMLLSILRPRVLTPMYFCSAKDYFSNKHSQRQEILQMTYNPSQPLRPIELNFKSLALNFFTTTLPLYQLPKVVMPNKQANAVDNSYVSVQVPVNADKQMQNSMTRLASKEVRLGRILECMDSTAGIVGYRHCFGSLRRANQFVLVTACVDSINLFEVITVDEDFVMKGWVNFVGKTSMEIEINLYQSNLLKCNALFTMVARSAVNQASSYPCPRLQIEHLDQPERSKALARQKLAQQNVQRRKKQIQTSYRSMPPSPQDTKIIHDIFLNAKNSRAENLVEIENTLVRNTHLMHVEERNLHNKIFGGFLMREMVETGWIAAARFAQHEQLSIQDLTNIYFKEPVEIGFHLKLTARVSYTRGNIIVVTIEAETYTFHPKPVQKTCCYMHMFITSKHTEKQVLPRSYENGIHYLTSRNAFNDLRIEQ